LVFTAVPDPHVVLRALEEDGALGRADFGDADVLAHYWFRARMVERLLGQAERLAVLPREDVAGVLRDLLGFDLAAHQSRTVVVPEGVHAATVRQADLEVRSARPGQLPAGVDRLAAGLATLPGERRSLPLLVSVGRLHPSKGMERLVEAWVSTPALRSAMNLVIIGGNLSAPSPDELDVLSRIEDLVDGQPGVILLGNLPHRDVARVLRAAAIGTPGVPAGGVYVGAARKEEFGLAIAEALAAGLPVVGPAGGGPTTYVRDGVTGVLADTSSAAALATAIDRAIALVPDPHRVALARDDILDRLTIENMAEGLVELYGSMTHAIAL
ncbi:MAG: glycosyltransferase, partial [Ilumatobacteraceae bacterium]